MMRLEGPGAFYKAYTTTVLAAGRSQLLLDRHALGQPIPACLWVEAVRLHTRLPALLQGQHPQRASKAILCRANCLGQLGAPS